MIITTYGRAVGLHTSDCLAFFKSVCLFSLVPRPRYNFQQFFIGATMDFTIPHALSEEIIGFKKFIKDRIISELPGWYHRQEIPAEFFHQLGAGGWYGIEF